MNMPAPFPLRLRQAWTRPGLRILLAIAVCFFAGWGARNAVLLRQLDLLAQQSRHHTEFYRLSLESLLSQNESLPRIVAMEARLKALLLDPGSELLQRDANNYLLDVKNAADINSAYLMDMNGLTLASSNFDSPGSYVGQNYGFRPYFQQALQGNLGLFYGIGATTGEPGFFLAAPVTDRNRTIGVAIVKISLENFESALVRSGEPVLLADTHGVIFLASVPEWKYHFLKPLDPAVIQQFGLSKQYGKQSLLPLETDLRLQNEPQTIRMTLPETKPQDYLVQSIRTGPLGWSIVLLAKTTQEQQNALLSGIAAGFAMSFLLLAYIFFRLNIKRYNERRQAEAALRRANKELEERIAERTADLRATNTSLEEKIDALKTTEGILRETRDSAVQAGKLAVLGQMAAGISHEVNQPLTAVHTFTDNAVSLLNLGRIDDVRENLGFIKQMADRMGHIVGEIKTFARKPSAQRQALRVADVIGQTLMLVEPRRRKTGARIDTQEPSPDVEVWADPQRLEQVLVNLLLNAIDAVAESASKHIEITLRCKAQQVFIVVCDSGPGIPSEVLPHLFEPFFTTKSSGQGLGLGLAISRMIVAEFGGRIEARNNATGGAEFTVVLEKA